MHSPSSYTRATTTNSEVLKELQAILNTGNRHRFPVKWKALKIFQGVDIDPYDVAGWLLAGEVDDPWRHSTRPADSSASALIHLVAYVDNDVYHFHWCLRFLSFLLLNISRRCVHGVSWLKVIIDQSLTFLIMLASYAARIFNLC